LKLNTAEISGKNLSSITKGSKLPTASKMYVGVFDNCFQEVASTARVYKNSSGDEIANVNLFYDNIAHVEASAYAH